MSACKEPSHRPYWVVTQRRCNHSAFNGYNWTPSDYSTVLCRVAGCRGCWRTKAAYIANLPDGTHNDPTISPGTIVAHTSGAP